MAPKKSSAAAKKASTAASAAKRGQDAQQKRALKEKVEQEALAQWIDSIDPLLDKAAENPIQMEELFSTKLVHRTFSQPGTGERPYDWSEFRKVLESRNASSPRWFMQLREEDLLSGDDGMEGVTVDCYIIAEAMQPTVAPGEYIVKVHWPYSDAEDNAPERILPLEGQGMCWRRVVKADGSDMNVFLLQKRGKTASAGGSGAAATATLASPVFAFGASASSTAAAAAGAPTTTSAPGFSFGNTPSAVGSVQLTAATSATSATPGLGFGFGAAPQSVGEAPAGVASGSSNGISFSFSFGQQAAKPPAPGSVDFGFSPATQTPAGAATKPPLPGSSTAAPVAEESGEVEVQPLKTSEVLFALWTRKRLTDLAKEIRSGSRIVREDFPLDGTKKIKLVMQNDRKDDVATTARGLLLNRLFAKQNDGVKAIDRWINDCPVFDEALTSALQGFRERQLSELASKSDLFQSLHNQYYAKIAAELQRIVALRDTAANKELERINAIMSQIKERKLAEKSGFRLLKFYAKNDVQKFRPFGKISGISEMGESVDVCVPPAHVNINPFTGKPI
ncbi:protein of unknown function - conserved [Leishmania donovani]|uniref:Hypothetical_protein_conserved n=1 Tax=Leishmania donovani TaxID=5661 RepID=A0A6J8FK30_LEIDO|nr:protein of unknown function - conserved [Leishmania donovani]VDZ48071.1 hypothetical_protein_conserved [Leishmania donovani]